MATTKTKPPQAPIDTALEARLAALEDKISVLIDAILYRKVPKPDKIGVGVSLANPVTAKRARMGRAARKAGMSFEDFAARYPGLDRWPPPPGWKPGDE